MDLANLGAVQGAEQSDYAKYLDALGQYNTDRAFDYGVWSDAYSRLANDLQTASGLEQLEYGKYLDALGQYNTDRVFHYGASQDALDRAERAQSEALELALLAAELGDYSRLQDMGIDTSQNPADWERKYDLAVLAAQLGDYSLLRELGVNVPGTVSVPGTGYASGGSSGSRGSSGGGSTSGGSGDAGGDGTLHPSLAAFYAGDHSDEVIAALLRLGMTREELLARGYTGDYFAEADASPTAPEADPADGDTPDGTRDNSGITSDTRRAVRATFWDRMWDAVGDAAQNAVAASSDTGASTAAGRAATESATQARNYAAVAAELAGMRQAGASRERILDALLSARSLLSAVGYLDLYNKYSAYIA